MRVTRVHSISVFVESFEQVKSYYTDLLTLPYGASTSGLRSLYVNDTSLVLLDAGTEDRALVGRNTGVALRTRGESDFAQLTNRIQEAGGAMGEVRQVPSGRIVSIDDPAGNRFWLWDAPHAADVPHLFDAPALITIGVSSMRRALPFYHGVLELPMIEQMGSDTALFFPDSTRVVIAASPEWTPAMPVTGETGLCLSVEGLDGYIDGLRHRGAKIVDESSVDGVLVAAAIQDPDGNQITLLQDGDR